MVTSCGTDSGCVDCLTMYDSSSDIADVSGVKSECAETACVELFAPHVMAAAPVDGNEYRADVCLSDVTVSVACSNVFTPAEDDTTNCPGIALLYVEEADNE